MELERTDRAVGPRGRFFTGSLSERKKDPLGLFLSTALQYGEAVFYKMGPKRVFQFTNPDAIKYIFQENSKNYIKGVGYDKLEPVLGKGLLTSEGEHWKRQRRIVQPVFHRGNLEQLVQMMADCVQSLEVKWKEKATTAPRIDAAREMMRLTLHIASVTLLGIDVSHEADEVGQALSRLLVEANRRILSLWPLQGVLPTPGNLQFRRDRETLNRVVFQIISERRKQLAQQPTGAKDILSLLLQARDEETGEGMSDEQIRDEVMTFFLAGHETTANALSWTFYLLSRYPQAAEKARAEIQSVLGGRTPTFEDLPKLKYTTCVLHESMRLYPPAWIFSREAAGVDEVLGKKISKGSVVILSPYVMHRHPKFWPNPEGFQPERFEAEGFLQKNRYIYIPFGVGPRQCIGNHFALMEMQLVLAMLLPKFQLDLVAGTKVEPEPMITLRPKGGLPMMLRNLS